MFINDLNKNNKIEMDRDPIFSKTLKLLHSNSKDAEDQLKSLLEEVVKQKYGISKTFANFFNKKDPKRESNSKSHSRKEERKSFDKHSDDSSESSSTKRPKIDSKSSSNHHQSSQSETSTPLKQAIIDLTKVEPAKKNNVKSDDDDDDDDDDFSLEILEEELTCVVCREMEVGVRNQLIECLECHSLYHQECHKPPISEDINDPRSAWYCGNCASSLNKPSKGARSSPKLSSSRHDSPHNIFKRSDSKSSHSSKSSPSPTPLGMAGLAASLQPSSKSSYSSSSSKSSSKSKKRF